MYVHIHHWRNWFSSIRSHCQLLLWRGCIMTRFTSLRTHAPTPMHSPSTSWWLYITHASFFIVHSCEPYIQVIENQDVSSLSLSVDSMLCDAKEFSFHWGNQIESASYQPFIQCLQEEPLKSQQEWGRQTDCYIYESLDIYTLINCGHDWMAWPTMSSKKPHCWNPSIDRFRIRGRTDIAVFKLKGIETWAACANLDI